MKGFEKMIDFFHREHPDYIATLDYIDSYPGCYRVAITEPVLGLTSFYTFRSGREFKEWAKGVVLD